VSVFDLSFANNKGGSMRRVWAWLRVSFHAAGLLTAIVDAAHAERLIFLSTQLRPIEEAQKMRNWILKDFPREVDYTTSSRSNFRCASRQSNNAAFTL
jgi:hypothetical protein